MKKLRNTFLFFGLSVLLVFFASCGEKEKAVAADTPKTENFRDWAKKPPLGWNSYDAYHGAVTEQQFLQSVDSLEKKLLPYGYDMATIDYCWFNPGPEGWDPDQWTTFEVNQTRNENGKLYPELNMDEYGRLLPAVNRFPSSVNGNGFTSIGEILHQKNMKFGIHIMRGIARQAVEANTPIKGTNYYAADIAKKIDTCKWNNNMYGVNPFKPGAQEYYNSLFDLYADWGVDFVKVDDISAPTYHSEEIELIRKAIDQTGRPMVLSLSCGESMVSYANHMEDNANLYRISIDFWDHWYKIAHMFDLAYAWQPHIGDGTWPDLDMIPIGNLCLTNYPGDRDNDYKNEHFSRLTDDEKKTLITLWSFAKSPLIWGGDPITSRTEDYAYLTNNTLLNINQNSTNNHQAANFVYEGMGRTDRIWLAESEDGNEKYVAFFNLGEEPLDLDFYYHWEYWDGTYEVMDIWTGEQLGTTTQKLSATEIPPHGVKAYKLVKIKV